MFFSMLARNSSICSRISGGLRRLFLSARAALSRLRTSSSTERTCSIEVDVYSNRMGNGNGGGTSSFGLAIGGLGGSSIFSTSSDFILWIIEDDRRAVPEAEKSMKPCFFISARNAFSMYEMLTSHGLM